MLRLQVQDPVKQVCVVGDSDTAWLMCCGVHSSMRPILMREKRNKINMVSNNYTQFTHTKQSVSLAQESCIPGKARTPVHLAGTVCRCSAVSWNSQEHQMCLSLQVWAPEVPPMPLVINESQPVYFASQYKTRYPFYKWVGCNGVLVMFFSSCSWI